MTTGGLCCCFPFSSLMVPIKLASRLKRSLLGRFQVWKDLFQKILGESYALLVRRLKALIRTVPRVFNNFGLARARVLSK